MPNNKADYSSAKNIYDLMLKNSHKFFNENKKKSEDICKTIWNIINIETGRNSAQRVKCNDLNVSFITHVEKLQILYQKVRWVQQDI